ncbi:MAG: AAC(3) family N-acetyltransferase, partial [Anaerolineae bacterium]|nr:AAC(3) family N-acetyltransferase [Anaerolineae bacterium]
MKSETFIEQFHTDLATLGLPQDAVVMVHSSLKSFGQVDGGAQTVINALLSYLSPNGTLLMPALSYENVRSDHPVFDIRSTPSCVGIIPETFRQMDGVLRSMHPTHSVCGIGKQAGELLAGHHKDHTPCGEHSSFHRLPKADGYVLMLGCGLRPNTSMHAIEELVEPPYLFGDPLEYTLIDADGNQTKKKYIRHNFANTEQRYDRLAQVMKPPGLRFGRICG